VRATIMNIINIFKSKTPSFLKNRLRPIYYKIWNNYPKIENCKRLTREELIEKLISVDRITVKIDLADHIIVMSEILKEAIMCCGIKQEKITVLGNRVDTALFHPIFGECTRNEKEIKLLFVGRQLPQKNLHNIIAAVMILLDRGYKPNLDIVGGGGKTLYTRSLLKDDIKKHCKFFGALRNSALPQAYNSVDMLISPSFFEGFQIPLIESLACGTPVVTSNQEPGNKIISEKTGALVDPADPEDIVKGILSVKKRLNDQKERLTLRINCRIEAITKWDYYLISKKEVEIYKGILGIRL
jgi:glycosyltransferase involved in cell wall biosynthesis